MDVEKAVAFIKKNARALDLAKYKCLFENGSKVEFLNELRKYQNNDGGFGHGIEPDFLNPASNPIATWSATEYIRKIYPVKTKNDVINGILNYLNSGTSFTHGMWLNTISSNNDYPHAIWWRYNEDNPSLNPTASLAAFIIDYAEIDSEVYSKAITIIKNCFHLYMSLENKEIDMHITSCMIQLYETLNNHKIDDLFNLVELKEKIIDDVDLKIGKSKDKWLTDYSAKPSDFLFSKNSFLFSHLKNVLIEELNYISETQLTDGSYNATWEWHTYFKNEESTSLQLWKSIICLKNLLLYANFSSLISSFTVEKAKN